MAPAKSTPKSSSHSTSSARPAPWDTVDPSEQLFVLITGANSGIGLGTGQRLIDDFLATRSLRAHLTLVPTTRSAAKSRLTIKELRDYADYAAQNSASLKSRAGGEGGYNWREHAARIHVLSIQIDLCDVRGIYDLARRMCTGTLSNPDGVEGPDAELQNVRLPRLDSVICNAAFGGWSGLSYLYFMWTILVDGFVQSVTWPKCKIAYPTRILNQQPAYRYPAKPRLGEVFCACVFGHYLLAHQLLPLLNRPPTSSVAPGRIIWSSSVEAVRTVFNPEDIQSLSPTSTPYESAKRLTDILALSHTLPSVRPISSSYLREDNNTADTAREKNTPPNMYLTHPGVVASTLFPLPGFLFWAYQLALVLARVIGSPWHTTDSYRGATSAAWIALQDQSALDEVDAQRVKWGSSTNRRNEAMVKVTEVEGWGWSGKVETVTEGEEDGSVTERILSKSIGRQNGVVDVTQEDIVEFEDLGRDVWEQMEELREEWEELLEL